MQTGHEDNYREQYFKLLESNKQLTNDIKSLLITNKKLLERFLILKQSLNHVNSYKPYAKVFNKHQIPYEMDLS